MLASWRGKLMAVFLALLLFPAIMRADDSFIKETTWNRMEPGDRIVYTGIPGVAFEEFGDYAYGMWKDNVELRYEHGMMSCAEYYRAYSTMSVLISETRNGKWWERSCFDSFPVEKGGARWPGNTYYCGPRDDILDLGFARVTNTFKFKLKEFTATIAGEFDEEKRRFKEDGWRFKCSPSLSTGTTTINSIMVRTSYTYFIRERDLVRLEMLVGYTKRQRGIIFFQFTLLRW